jgi:thiol-disulfide isomerase/thioredoxin
VAVRPRLLRGSLLVAVVLIVAWVVVLATRDSGESLGESDPLPPVSGSLTPGDTSSGIATNADVTGDPLPSALVSDLAGEQIDTTALAGQPLVINIWFSTCAPCREELPDFAEVHAELGDQVDFVGINQFPASDREEDFARDLGVTYPLYYDGNSEFISQLGIARYPVTLFVTPDGTIARQAGQLDAERLRSIIAQDLL